MNESNRVGNIIDGLTQQLGVKKRLKTGNVWQLWDDEVGDRIKTHTQVIGVKGDTLAVRVDSAAWMYQLVLLKPEIIAKINQRLGKTLINNIHFKIGKLDKNQPQSETNKGIQLKNVILPDGEREKIEGSLSQIEDDKLRDALRRLLVKDKKLKMSKTKRGRNEII